MAFGPRGRVRLRGRKPMSDTRTMVSIDHRWRESPLQCAPL